MAELADAADSKFADTWYRGGSTPPPGTTPNFLRCCRLAAFQVLLGESDAGVPTTSDVM
jgi:hypothetical protein